MINLSSHRNTIKSMQSVLEPRWHAMRRDANPTNNQTEGNLLGDKQEAYLTKALLTSKATWKVLALDGPVSIVVGGEGDWDAWAQVPFDHSI